MKKLDSDDVVCGVLSVSDGDAVLADGSPGVNLSEYAVWSGYLRHWSGGRVCAQRMEERDYRTGKKLLHVWPETKASRAPFMELYYNERLVKYIASTFGHLAVNVDGAVFNFSHLMNECEMLSCQDYFYRPALGRFAPDPGTGRFNVEDPERPYLDKFGRLFMRTVHAARLEGIDTSKFHEYYANELSRIHSTPCHPDRPEKYRDFSFFSRSCATIIRDGLRENGFRNVRGLLPREVFISAMWEFRKSAGKQGARFSYRRMPQLKVDEAPYSSLSPILNPVNAVKQIILRSPEGGCLE